MIFNVEKTRSMRRLTTNNKNIIIQSQSKKTLPKKQKIILNFSCGERKGNFGFDIDRRRPTPVSTRQIAPSVYRLTTLQQIKAVVNRYL